MFGKIFSKREAIVFVAILLSTFSNDTGLQFFKCSVFFFFFFFFELKKLSLGVER